MAAGDQANKWLASPPSSRNQVKAVVAQCNLTAAGFRMQQVPAEGREFSFRLSAYQYIYHSSFYSMGYTPTNQRIQTHSQCTLFTSNCPEASNESQPFHCISFLQAIHYMNERVNKIRQLSDEKGQRSESGGCLTQRVHNLTSLWVKVN